MSNKKIPSFLLHHVMGNFLDKPCPHCGIILTGDDEETLSVSNGGKFFNPGGLVAAHGKCFYLYEANDEWKQAHPQFKPEGLSQLKSDEEMYVLLLKEWLAVWDTIEEWIADSPAHERIEALYDLTKKEIDPTTKTKVTGDK